MIKRSLSFALGVLALLLASAAVALVLMVWRLASGPVSLEFLTPYIEEALTPDDGRLRIEVGGTAMRLSAERGIELVALDVRGTGPDGQVPIELPEIGVDLSLEALLLERVFAPTHLDADAPRLVLARSEAGRIGLASAVGEPGDEAPTLDVRALVGPLQRQPDPEEPLSYLRTVHIRGALLVLEDRMSNTTLRADAADLTLRRDAQGLRGRLDFKLEQPDHVVDVSLRGRYRASAPLAYELQFAGLTPGDVATFVSAVPASGLDLSLAGTLAGGVTLEGDLLPVRFELEEATGRIDLPEHLARPIELDSARASGGFDPDQMSLTLDELALAAHGARLRASGTGAWQDEGLRLRADIEAEQVTLATLKRFWPPEAGDGAREWVVENITAGVASRGEARIVIEPGDLDQRPVPQDLITGSFDYRGLTVGYFKDFPPITGIEGSATFDARTMRFTAGGGAVGALEVGEGDVAITGIGIEGDYETQLEARATIEGPLDQALALLEREPLGFPGKLGIDPANAAGRAVTALQLGLPLYREVEAEELRVSAEATLSEVAITDLFGRIDLQNGRFDLEVTDEGMDLAGETLVEQIPLSVDWRENFGDDQAVQRRYRLSGTVEEADLRALGVPELPSGLEGRVGFSIDGSQMPTSQQLEARLDLAQAGIAVPWLGWHKRPGEPGSLSLEMTVPDEGVIDVGRFALEAGELEARGTLQVQQEPVGLRLLSLDRLSFRDQQLSGSLRHDAGAYRIDLVAQTLDLAPLIEEDEGREADIDLPPLEIGLQADQVLLGGGELRAVSAHARRDPKGWQVADLTATLPGGGRLDASLVPEGGARRLTIFSTDAGALLGVFDDDQQVRGGTFNLAARITRQQPHIEAEGTVSAQSFTLVEAPVLARLLTLASLRGIGNVLGGKGIAFDRLSVPFRLADGVLTLDRGRMSGSQLGLTFEGTIDTRTDRLDVDGTVVPIYTINRIIGDIPVIGDFLTGSEGEGAFAATFTMRGDIEDPEIVVNPLSVLAPGFVRELFSGIREGTTTAPEPPPGADD